MLVHHSSKALRCAGAAQYNVQRLCKPPKGVLRPAPQLSVWRGPGVLLHKRARAHRPVQATTGDRKVAVPKSRNGLRGFWTTVDVLAILGSVGGALVSLLGLVSSSYVLALPVVLPVVSLIAALQREGLIREDSTDYMGRLGSDMRQEALGVLAEVREALSALKQEPRGSLPLGPIEAKLSALEGSIISTGRSSREALGLVGSLPSTIQRSNREQYEALVAALRQEVTQAMDNWATDYNKNLARLEARLVGLEALLNGMEAAEMGATRQLNLSLGTALADLEARVANTVSQEMGRSVEAFRQLSDMVVSAQADSRELPMLPAPRNFGEIDIQLQGQLRDVVAREVEAAVMKVMASQEFVARLNSRRTMMMEDEQWSALGKRLTRIELLIEQVPQLSGQVVEAQIIPVAAQRIEILAAELTTSQTQGINTVRQDIRDWQGALEEAVRLLSSGMQPLRDSLTEIQGVLTNLRVQIVGREVLPSEPLDLSSLTDLLKLLDLKLEGLSYSMRQAQEVVSSTQQSGYGGDGQLGAAELTRLQPVVLEIVGKASEALQSLEHVHGTCDMLASSLVELSAEMKQQVGLIRGETEDCIQAVDGRLSEAISRMQSYVVQMEAQVLKLQSLPELKLREEPGAASTSIPDKPSSGDGGEHQAQDDVKVDAALQPVILVEAKVVTQSVEQHKAVAGGDSKDEIVSKIEDKSGPSAGGSRQSSDNAPLSTTNPAVVEPTGRAREEVIDDRRQPTDVEPQVEDAPVGRQQYNSAQVHPVRAETGGGAEAQSVASPSSRAPWSGETPGEYIQRTDNWQDGAWSATDLGGYGRAGEMQGPVDPYTDYSMDPYYSNRDSYREVPSNGLYRDSYVADGQTYGQQPVSRFDYSQQDFDQSQTSAYQDYNYGPSRVSPTTYPEAPVYGASPPGSTPAPPGALGDRYSGSDYGSSEDLSGRGPNVDAQLVRQESSQRMMSTEYLPAQGEYSSASSPLPYPPVPPQPPYPPSNEGWGPASSSFSESPYQQDPRLRRREEAAAYDGHGFTGGEVPDQVIDQPSNIQRPDLQAGYQETQRPGGQGAAGNYNYLDLSSPTTQGPSWGNYSPLANSYYQSQPQPQPPPFVAAEYPTRREDGFPPPSTAPSVPMSLPAMAPGPEEDLTSSFTMAPTSSNVLPFESLPETELMQEGLSRLKQGRELLKEGQDYGVADSMLYEAEQCFSEIVRRSPTSTKALGNLGNAKLARGELKQVLLEELLGVMRVSGAGSWEEEASQKAAVNKLRLESTQYLTGAGEQFKRVLEVEGWSSRALVNWGRAMCLRAEVAEAPEVVAKLYRAAIDKFEAVLEEEPDMVLAKFRCALAMIGLASSLPGSLSREAVLLLKDAVNYLQDVTSSTSPDAEGILEAAVAAQKQAQQQLAALQPQKERV